MKYLAGLSGEAAAKALSELRTARNVVERIVALVEKDQESSVKAGRSVALFDTPSWAERQAFELGKQANAQTVMDMLNQALKEKD